MSQRTLEDQAEAMVAGYASSTEWAFHKLLGMVRELTARVDRLEGKPEVVEHDPED